MPGVDTASMSREEYLLFRGRNEKITITEADLAHARHGDNCPICQDDERTAHAGAERERKLDAARIAALGLLHSINETVSAMDVRIQLGQPLPTPEEFVEALRKAARKTHNAHQRAWSK